MGRWFLASLALPVLVAAAPAGRTLSERAARADRVALVQVLDSSVQVPDGDPARMTTLTRLTVDQDLKGTGPASIELVQVGGRYGDWERRVAGDATFTSGERAVVFLRCRTPERPDRCVLVGLAQGKLPVVPGSAPPTVRIVSLQGEQTAPLAKVAAEISTPGTAPGTKHPEAGSKGASPKVSR